MTEFSFLDEDLQEKLRQAEELVERYPDLSLTATRTFCEWLQDALAELHEIGKKRPGEPQHIFTNRLRSEKIIPPHEASLFHSIRRSANSATHNKGARALDARQKLAEAKALAFWYDQIRRDRVAISSNATDITETGVGAYPTGIIKSPPEDAKITAGDQAGCENISIIAQASQLDPQSATIDLIPIEDLKSTQTETQGPLGPATNRISNRATQRPPHKWLSDSFRVRRARLLLLSKHGRRIQRKILARHGVKVRRASSDCIYFEGPDQQTIARAETEFFWRIWSPLSLVLGWG